jgi:beta-galactosidase
METAPGTAQWQPPLVYRFPGVHKLTSLQAVAHGSDSVMYFQWRKGRGGFEQFHGAVVDHCGHEHTHVFRDVADTGKALQNLRPALGGHTEAKVAIYWDWDNFWVAEYAGAPVQGGQQERQTAINHYRAFWDLGIPVDIVGPHSPLDGCTLLIAPMLYMTNPETADRFRRFVEAGGTLVSTYWTGIADESGLCHLGGFPGPLRSTLGLWVEMTDAPIHVTNTLVPAKENELGLTATRAAHSFCDLLHPEGARVLASYGQNWYAGWPCLTCNDVGKGKAYYIGTRTDGDFLADFYGALSQKLGLRRDLDGQWPGGVGVRKRSANGRDFVFLMNFNHAPAVVTWNNPSLQINLLDESRARLQGRLRLPAYGIAVLTQAPDRIPIPGQSPPRREPVADEKPPGARARPTATPPPRRRAVP